jgi:hypothetical protein
VALLGSGEWGWKIVCYHRWFGGWRWRDNCDGGEYCERGQVSHVRGRATRDDERQGGDFDNATGMGAALGMLVARIRFAAVAGIDLLREVGHFAALGSIGTLDVGSGRRRDGEGADQQQNQCVIEWPRDHRVA